jgi:hypothetical protein
MHWRYWRIGDDACEDCLHTCKSFNCYYPIVYNPYTQYCLKHHNEECRYQDNRIEREANFRKAALITALLSLDQYTLDLTLSSSYESTYVQQYWKRFSDKLPAHLNTPKNYKLVLNFQKLVYLRFKEVGHERNGIYSKYPLIHEVFNYFMINNEIN